IDGVAGDRPGIDGVAGDRPGIDGVGHDDRPFPVSPATEPRFARRARCADRSRPMHLARANSARTMSIRTTAPAKPRSIAVWAGFRMSRKTNSGKLSCGPLKGFAFIRS